MKPEPRQKKRKQTPKLAEEGKKQDWQEGEFSDDPSARSSIPEDQHWVQCENPDCLKWRIISRQHADALNVDEQWFCKMNPNVLFSSCSTPEEKYSSKHKMKQHGLTYKYSLLPEGSLVWAKLSGYCKWPSIICCQPGSSEFVILDNDGDPHSYHIEFLGTRHSIAWVYHTKVDAYGNLGKQEALETCSQPLSMVSMNRFKTGGKKRKRASLIVKKKTSVRLAEQLQAAIDEADQILELERTERLEKCKIICEIKKVDKNKKTGSGRKLVEEDKKMKGKKRKHPDESKRKGRPPKRPTATTSSQLLLPGSQKLSDHKLTDFASKEDRLMADIQGLQALEQEFLDDYAKFTKRKPSTITGPHWQGVAVSLFQLFMTVQEKGGFNEVCANMRWKEVVLCCCDTNKCISSAASTAMTYYSRHLLPYEMHVKRGGILPVSLKASEKVKKRIKDGNGVDKKPKVSKKSKSAKIKSSNIETQVGEVIEDEAVKELKEMEELLNEMNSEADDDHGKNDIITAGQVDGIEKQSSMDFFFNDDSQLPKKNDDQFTQLMSQSQPKTTQGATDGVDCEDLFGNVSPSQVVPEVASLQVIEGDSTNHVIGDITTDNSEEDLFAEIDRDEQLLQSLLDST